MTIAVVVITKDEERNIGDCLESARWADELVVVDAESLDGTVNIARKYSDKVFIRPWPGFGPQWNYGLDKATAEWVFVLAADERIPTALKEEILTVLADCPPADVGGYEVPRRNFFYGQWIRHAGFYPDYGLRLFRRTAGRYNDVLFHENLILQGRVVRLANPLDHYSMPGIREHVQKMIRYTTLGAQEKLKRRSRITTLDVAGNHLVTALKTYVLRKGCLDGVPGLIVSGFAGMHTFVKYAKAWEQLSVRGGKRSGSTIG